MLGIVAWARARTTLRDAALAGVVLFGYLVWVLGGWQWVVAPLVVFVVYTRLFPPTPDRDGDVREHDMHAVAGVIIPGLFWLFVANVAQMPQALVPYTATFVAQLAMIGVVHASQHAPGGGAARLLRHDPEGCRVVLPAMTLHRPLAEVPAAVGLALAGAVVATVAFNRGARGVAAGLALETQWDPTGALGTRGVAGHSAPPAFVTGPVTVTSAGVAESAASR